MPGFIFYIILGFVQGILEWLPVSSEGQLVVISLWFSDSTVEDAISLAFWLHLGTMFAVVVYYFDEWKKILDLRNLDYYSERKFIILSTFGTGIVGVPIKVFLIDAVDWTNLSNIFMMVIGISLLVTGYLVNYSRSTGGTKELGELSSLQMLLVGLAQGLTIIPGISRSGTTTSAMLLIKTDPEDAFRGSFLISVPAVIGAVLLDATTSYLDNESLIGSLDSSGIVAAIVIAFVCGLFTIKLLLDLVRKYNFSVIAYLLGLTIIVISIVLLAI